MNIPHKPKSIIVISSHVTRGSVGNRASVLALETLGFPVWAVPTITLPWHPGHGKATRIVPDDAAFLSFLDDLLDGPFIDEVGAILTGYMASEKQVDATAQFIKKLKQKTHDLTYICDPVIGDESGLYVTENIAAAMRDKLVPIADLITPNRFELSWLADIKFSSNKEILETLRMGNYCPALVTSAFAMLRASTGNLYADRTHAWLAEHRAIDNAPNGTGDLMAALFLGRLQSGMDIETALRVATQSVFELLARTAKRGADELTLELDMASLRNPASMVQLRSIGAGLPKRPA